MCQGLDFSRWGVNKEAYAFWWQLSRLLHLKSFSLKISRLHRATFFTYLFNIHTYVHTYISLLHGHTSLHGCVSFFSSISLLHLSSTELHLPCLHTVTNLHTATAMHLFYAALNMQHFTHFLGTALSHSSLYGIHSHTHTSTSFTPSPLPHTSSGFVFIFTFLSYVSLNNENYPSVTSIHQNYTA